MKNLRQTPNFFRFYTMTIALPTLDNKVFVVLEKQSTLVQLHPKQANERVGGMETSGKHQGLSSFNWGSKLVIQNPEPHYV